MDPTVIIVPIIMLVPISAIVGGYWQKVVRMTQEHRLEMARIQVAQHASLDVSSLSELSALRQEVAALRDTTTQYDLSVERNMREMMQRLQYLEGKNAPAQPGGVEMTVVPASSSAPIRTGHAPDMHSRQQPDEAAVRLQAGS